MSNDVLAPLGVRPVVLPRLRLLRRLEACLQHRVTLVSAPAGFGKSALIAQLRGQLAQRRHTSVVWLSFELVGRRWSDFVRELVVGLRDAGMNVAVPRLVPASEAEPRPETVAGVVVTTLHASAHRCVLIVDDVPARLPPPVRKLLLGIAAHAGDRLQLLLSGRALSMRDWMRLQVGGQLAVIGATDLAFTEEETRAVLAPVLTGESATRVHAATEGWPAAVWMMRDAHLVSPDVDAIAAPRGFAEYVSAEVLGDVSPTGMRALRELATLGTFDRAIGDRICGGRDAARRLGRVSALNGLLLPAGGTRLRLNRLLGHALAADLAREDPARVCRLHRRAARSYEAQEQWCDAIRHLVLAGDRRIAAERISSWGWEFVLRFGADGVRAVLALFAGDEVHRHPSLRGIRAYLGLKAGELAEAQADLDVLRAASGAVAGRARRDAQVLMALARAYSDTVAENDFLQDLGGQIDALRQNEHAARATLLSIAAVGCLGVGRFADAEAHARQAAVHMRHAGLDLAETYEHFHIGQSLAARGRYGEAMVAYAAAQARAEPHGVAESSLLAISHCLIAEVQLLQGDPAGARRRIDPALNRLEDVDGWFEVYASAYETAMRLALNVAGDMPAAFAVIERAERTARVRRLPRLSRLCHAWRLEALVTAGELDEAQKLSAALGVDDDHQHPAGASWRWRSTVMLALARLAIARGQPAAAARCCRTLRLDAEQLDRRYVVAQVALLEAAIAALRNGEQSPPAAAVLSAIVYAQQERLMRLGCDLGPATRAVLDRLRAHGRDLGLPTAISSWLREARTQQTFHGPADGFSTREREVLAALVHGHGNKQISRQLGVSVNTVKFHLKKLFQKLEVTTRAAAATAALSLQLVVPTPALPDRPAEDRDA